MAHESQKKSNPFVIFFTGLCLYLVYPGWSGAGSTVYLSAISIMTASTLLVFFFAGLYEPHPQSYYKQPISMLIIVYSVLFLILIASNFTLKNSEEFSRIWTFSWYFFSLLLLSQVRFFYHRLIDKWSKTGLLTRNIAIIGALEQGTKLVEVLRQNNEPWLRIAGIYNERRSRVPTAIHGYPVNSNLDNLIEDVRNDRINDVLIALPWSAEHRTLKIIPVPVRLCPDMVGFNFRHHSFSHYGAIPTLNVHESKGRWEILPESGCRLCSAPQ